MLNNFFQHQAHIVDIECDCRCPDDCNLPGCRKADIIVEIILFDLIRLSRFLETPVSHLFSQYCYLGLRILSIYNFIVDTNFTKNPTLPYPGTHYSSIPIGAKPLT